MKTSLFFSLFFNSFIVSLCFERPTFTNIFRRIGTRSTRQGQLREILLTTTETESQIIEKYDDMDIIVDPVGLKEISDDEFNTEVLSHAGISVVLFSSHWCQPCRSMQMVVEAAKNSVVLRNENVKYLTIDTDENPLSSSEFQLRSIPSTLIFKNGRVVSDIIGLSSVSAVISEVQKHTLLNLPDIKVSSFE